MNRALLIFLSFHFFACEAQILNKEQQISDAMQAAPPEKASETTVMGYDAKGELAVLREGSNELICIADDPNKEGFQAVCYHKDLEPFMKRGRELKTEGKDNGEIDEIREKEVQAGQLKMPENPSTLHVLYGTEISRADDGKISGASLRYVVYIPYATPESTGLPIRPLVPGGAWLMNPGTHRAHIMITPPQEK